MLALSEENILGTQEGREFCPKYPCDKGRRECPLEEGNGKGPEGLYCGGYMVKFKSEDVAGIELKSQEDQLEPGQTLTCMPPGIYIT